MAHLSDLLDLRRDHRADRTTSRRPRSGLTLLVVLICALTVAPGCASGDATAAAGWQLIWRDDFDSLDPMRWNVQNLASTRNQEWQYYTPDNVAVAAGRLRLTSQRDTPVGDRTFTSGAVDTYGKFSFTYGRVEIDAKLPVMGPGVWPALWMLENGCHPSGHPCPWPTKGANEIDIMEAVNQSTPYYGNLHFGTELGQSLTPGKIEYASPDLSSSFHTFAIEWEEGGTVRWYFDGLQIGERSAPGYFTGPMYLFLNTALGGEWPGPVTDATPFPQEFEIDAVRVYQRQPSSAK